MSDDTNRNPDRPGAGPQEARADTQRDQLIGLAIAREAEFWRDLGGDTFASVIEDGCPRHIRLRSEDGLKLLRRLWAAESCKRTGRVTSPNSQSLKDALGTLQMLASEGPVHQTFVRIGHADGNIYVDLGDPTGRAVEITNKGWTVVPQPKVRFLRP
ncbi:MAG TPA: hypothetical protein VGU45_13620, partial [Microvirga sp.]|nr:hypothetical protein [Microvirga sp.]